MASENAPRLAGVFDRLIESNLLLHTSTQKLHKSIHRYVLVVLVAVLVMAGISAFEVWHSLRTDRRLERLEEKVFSK